MSSKEHKRQEDGTHAGHRRHLLPPGPQRSHGSSAQSQVRITIYHVPATSDESAPREFLQTRADTYSRQSGAKGDRTGPYQLGEEWLTGKGPRKHVFGAGDPMTELLRKHDHIRALVLDVCQKLRKGELPPPGFDNYRLSGFRGVPLYARDYSNVLTGGRTGNLAVTYLGSYALDYHLGHLDRTAGRAELLLHVANTSTLGSATHPPVIGYTPLWNKEIDGPLNRQFSSGPLSLTRQDFYWTEYLDLAKPQCR